MQQHVHLALNALHFDNSKYINTSIFVHKTTQVYCPTHAEVNTRFQVTPPLPPQ